MKIMTKLPLRDKLNDKIGRGRKIISVYLTLGYPDLQTSINAMIAAANAGADIIEIGIPFSDPMADGPTIQYTNKQALSAGLSIHDLETAINKLREHTDVAIVIMTYANIIYQYPLSQFKDVCNQYEIDGVIIPDIPPDHALDIVELNPIFLVAPNTELERVKQIAKETTGFVYIVSKLGITGGKYQSDNRLNTIYNTLEKENPMLPRLQGFGINTVNSVENAIDRGAHGVIIGSHLLKLLGDKGDINAVTEFINKIRATI